MPLTEAERSVLDAACGSVPPPDVAPVVGSDSSYPDYVTNLLLTVLDLQLDNVIVNNAITYYWKQRWDEVRDLAGLEQVLARFPDDEDGNRLAALFLWNYRYGNRIGWLRNLVAWCRSDGLTDQASLFAWAYTCDFRRDFEGRARGLGIAAFCWLRMRLGVDTVKPDSWLHGFVRRVVGHDLSDLELIDELTAAAHRVGRTARELDAGIWEHERGGPGSI
jgi:hypothetical protein